MHQDFIRGSTRRQQSVASMAAIVTVVTVLVVAVAVYGIRLVVDDDDNLRIRVSTPSVGPGVKSGAAVILNGAEVGHIVDLRRADDAVLMDLELSPAKVEGLTDTFGMDFRPENYFGVTAVNIFKGSGGSELRSGVTLTRDVAPDYTMSTMIERSSLLVDGGLNAEMVRILDDILRYTNGLTPLLRAGLVFADQVAKTQRALPSELLGDANSILEVFPDFLGQAVESGYTIYQGKYNRLPDGSIGINDRVLNMSDAGLKVASGTLFAAAGTLLRSHATELTPAVEIVRLYADVVPDVLGNGTLGPKLRTVLNRFTTAFGGTAGQPSLRLRVVMDDLPGVAAPLGLAGLRQDGGRR